jgi:hypothetical protein
MKDIDAFEAVARELDMSTRRSSVHPDSFAYDTTNQAWKCWQAARAHIAATWDGCVHEASGGDVDIGASIRTDRMVGVREVP